MAAQHGVRLEEVLLVIHGHCTDHDGTVRLDECFEAMEVDLLLALAGNSPLTSERTATMTALVKMTGLDADFIRLQLRQWNLAKHKRMF